MCERSRTLAGEPFAAHGWRPSTPGALRVALDRQARARTERAGGRRGSQVRAARRRRESAARSSGRSPDRFDRRGTLRAWRVSALTRGLQSVELKDERVRAALVRLDEMSDSELRELVQGEPPIFVEAAEGIIARRTGRVTPVTSDRAACQIRKVCPPWSSELAAALRRDREELRLRSCRPRPAA